MSQIKSVNGYYIINEDNFTALAYNPNAVEPWVTWSRGRYEFNSQDYFWGHYFKDQDEAVRDYVKRVNGSVKTKIYEYMEVSGINEAIEKQKGGE